jgi:hypothetical protein
MWENRNSGITASQLIAGLARIMGNGDYDRFFGQLNRDYTVLHIPAQREHPFRSRAC